MAASLTLWCAAGLIVSRALRTGRRWAARNICPAVLLAALVVPLWTT